MMNLEHGALVVAANNPGKTLKQYLDMVEAD
jgi:hypothetical protein